MAEGQRKSSRPVKIKREAGFIYDTESVNFLSRRVTLNSSSSESQEDSTNKFEGFNGKDTAVTKILTWTDLYSLPSLNSNANLLTSESPVLEVTRSQSQYHQKTDQLGAAQQVV